MNQSPMSAHAKPSLLLAASVWLLIGVFPAPFFACLLYLPASAADSATVSFTFDFPNSSPEHYSITVENNGHAHYESSGKLSDDSDDSETYQTDFEFSDATRVRIFDLAAQSHYFSGKIDSGNKKLAFTGSKKLAYRDAQRGSTAEYNFSSIPAVQQLTSLFQSLSATLEYGHRLAYFLRFQKLALDDELKRMEDQARRGEIVELQTVKPILRQIYDDDSVINIDRARALRIIDMVPSPTAGK